MKSRLLILFALLMYNFCLNAQAEHWIVKSGENINTALPVNVKFHYPNFTQGSVFFRDGTQSNALLDYDLLTGEMQFIAPKGDTLALSNEVTIKYIVIGIDSFFYDKVYLQLVTGNPTAKLAKKEILGIGDLKKAGGYDQVSSTSAITTVSSMNGNGQATNLTANVELVILKATTYYIGDIYNNFLLASKKNVLRLFGNKQKALEQYLKDNKCNFNKEQDLKTLIAFLVG